LSFKDAEKLIKKILDIVEKIGNWSGWTSSSNQLPCPR